MRWYYCVCFLAEAGRPRPFGFNFGDNYLKLVIFCGLAFGVKFVCVLLGPIWRVVIVFTGCIREFSVFVCWLRVCVSVIFVKWNDRMSFLAEVVSSRPFRFYCGGEFLVLVLYMGFILVVTFACVV